MAAKRQGITWTNEKRKLSDLIPWERNPRTINTAQAERLVDSVETFGQVETLAIDCHNGVLNGHQRLNVLAGQYGMDYEVDVRVANRVLTERERQQLTVYLHRGTTGAWDFEELANSFEFEDLVTWGFSEEELLGLDFGEEPTSAGADTEPQIDKTEELRAKWNVSSGQLWALGDHRLFCGDCTAPAVVARVMGGEKADLLLTDPPYGVDYGASVRGRENQKAAGWDDIQNDALSDDDLLSLLKMSLHGSGALIGFVWHPAGPRRWLFWSALEHNGWRIAQEIVWVKNALVFGRADYQWRHEPCMYVKREGAPRQDDRTQTTVWEVNKPTNSMHPTQKPIELFEIPIKNHTHAAAAVYDPFVGSGTTLIACQNLGRKCRAVEISPGYVAVALQRFADHAGIEPVLIDDLYEY